MRYSSIIKIFEAARVICERCCSPPPTHKMPVGSRNDDEESITLVGGAPVEDEEVQAESRLTRRTVSYMIVAFVVVMVIVGVVAGVVDVDDGTSSLPDDPEARANVLLEENVLIDGHNDLPWQIYKQFNNHLERVDLDKVVPTTQTDIVRLRRGKLGAQFWAAYVECNSSK